MCKERVELRFWRVVIGHSNVRTEYNARGEGMRVGFHFGTDRTEQVNSWRYFILFRKSTTLCAGPHTWPTI